MTSTSDRLVNLLRTAGETQCTSQGSSAVDPLSTFPEPGFTVKTKYEAGGKVFINVCSSPIIPSPHGWPSTSKGSILPPEAAAYLSLNASELAEAELKRGEALLAIPMHLSTPRADDDHQRQACSVLDAVTSPLVLQAALESRAFKMFLVHLAMGRASKALGVQLDPHFKLPRMQCKGVPGALPILPSRDDDDDFDGSSNPRLGGSGELRLPKSTALDKSKEFVQELEPPPSRFAFPLPSGSSSATFKAFKPCVLKYTLRYPGRPATHAELAVRIPDALLPLLQDTPGKIRVEIGWDAVEIWVPQCQACRVPLPLAGGGPEAGARATLATDTGILTVIVPLISFKELSTWVRQSRVGR